MPGWLQGTAQVFPVCRLDIGMRFALLPPGAASVEIAGSRRVQGTAAVLGAWVLAGLIIAPLALRGWPTAIPAHGSRSGATAIGRDGPRGPAATTP
jgi:hypothetical protein